MGTFTTKEIVDRIVAGNGWDDIPDGPGGKPYPHDQPDNPRCVRVVEYITPEGQTCWGLSFAGEPDPRRYDVETQWIRSPRLLWEAS